MKKLILTLAVVALVATPAFAQSPVFGHVGSDTAGSVAMLVKYVGTAAASATTDVEVEAAGNMVFRVAGSADTLVNTAAAGALCGATPGTLDLSTPAATCNSLGEVVDVINASGDWKAVLVAGMRSDLSDNTLVTRAATSGMNAQGVPLYFDSTVSLYASIPLIPENCKTDIRCFMTPAGKLLENPAMGTQTEVRWVEGYSTWNTTSNFKIYSVKPRNLVGTGSEVETTLWSEPAGATGTNKQLTQFQYFGLKGKPNEKVIVRVVDTSTGSAFILHAYGAQK